MKNPLKSMKDGIEKATEMASSAAKTVADTANHTFADAKEAFHTIAEHENTKQALEWSKEAGSKALEETGKLGREFINSDLGKASAKGAAIGGAAGIPLPVLGPVTGAIVGAGVGAYLHLKHGVGKTDQIAAPKNTTTTSYETPSDVVTMLAHLDELREKGVITAEEYQQKKVQLLERI